MPLSPAGSSVIPSHLPRRLAISFWLWNYFGDAGEGGHFHDLERRVVELKERGFNTIRLDDGAGLCHTPQGAPRGPVTISAAFPGHDADIRQVSTRGGRCDVAERLLQLLALARKHDVYVILSSWLYLHTFWFVRGRHREEILSIPPPERLMRIAEEHSRLLRRVEQAGLDSRIAFVEITNECDGGQDYGAFTHPGGEDARRARYRELHEAALAFLRERHPRLLFACDTCHSGVHAGLLPRNLQVWNHHMYYLWPLYGRHFEGEVFKPDFDFSRPHACPAIGRFLRQATVPIEQVRASADNDPHVFEDWYRRIWLYRNLDPARLGELDALLAEALRRDPAPYRKAAEDGVRQAVAVRDRDFPGVPLVMGEAVSYCAHTGMRWEERSDDYWSLLEHTNQLAREAGYWGYMPRTHSGPEDASWSECVAQLRRLNRLFLESGNFSGESRS